MNTIDTADTGSLAKIYELPRITQKLGKTTFEVFVHFSETSKETMTDKVMRLIRNDIATNDIS